MIPQLNFRPITIEDADSVLRIYQPYIENTAITFEYTLPELSDWGNRIETITKDYPWLVVEWNHKIVGYAYAAKHRDRIAYSWDAEVSVYIQEGFQGKGLATLLYEKLLGILKLQGFVNVYAIITSPNPKSEKFHEAFGFYDVGKFHKSGFKFGKWFDTRWMQLHIGEHNEKPSEIISFSTLRNTADLDLILKFP